MKKIGLFFLIISPLFNFMSCHKESEGNCDDSVTASLGQCDIKIASDQTIRICYDSLLEDSRCPADANCIWSGVAKVQLTANVGSAKTTFQLSTIKLAPSYNTDTTISGFHIKLTGVQPYPGLGTSPRLVQLQVTK